jgi:hypothetical protein
MGAAAREGADVIDHVIWPPFRIPGLHLEGVTSRGASPDPSVLIPRR